MPEHSPTPTAAQQDHEATAQHSVTIHVNEQPVTMPERETTGAQIKATAIEQGVPVQPDFVLVEELGHSGRTRVIGDGDTVHLTANSRFLANDGDDNS